VGVVGFARETPPRILVVDDHPDALTIMRLLLEHHGFQVITADSVRDAVRQMQEGLPDLVITDYSMPELTGLDLCRHLRHDRLTCRIPIVMHTGTDMPRTEAGLYDEVFEKPADLGRLVQKAWRLTRPARHAGSLDSHRANR
jgi:two-component system, OmpR family, phosphate regulon response regulator PhoB